MSGLKKLLKSKKKDDKLAKKAQMEIEKKAELEEKQLIDKVEKALKKKGYIVCCFCDRPIINHTLRRVREHDTANKKAYAHDICLTYEHMKNNQ